MGCSNQQLLGFRLISDLTTYAQGHEAARSIRLLRWTEHCRVDHDVSVFDLNYD